MYSFCGHRDDLSIFALVIFGKVTILSTSSKRKYAEMSLECQSLDLGVGNPLHNQRRQIDLNVINLNVGRLDLSCKQSALKGNLVSSQWVNVYL